MADAKEEMKRVHHLLSVDNDITFYRRLQSQGYHCPEMSNEAIELQYAYLQHQEPL